MANSIKTYVWNSSTHSNTSDFIAPTPLSGRGSTDIKVKVGSTILTSGYTLTVDSSNVAKVRFQTLPNNGDPIRIYRETKHDGRLVDFVDGSLLTSETLDLDSNQLFYMAQEAYDKGEETTIGRESFYYSQGTDPTSDAANIVNTGALWYDTSSSTNTLQVWSGTEWQATAPAKVTKKYGTTTAGGKTAVVSHPTNGAFSQFTDAAFTSGSSLYLNGVKLVETSSIYTIPSEGDYTVDNGTVTFLDLSSASDILVSETFDGSFSSSVTASEANALDYKNQAGQSSTGAAQSATSASGFKDDAEDFASDAQKYAINAKDQAFTTSNGIGSQYSAKHYAETAAGSATTASNASNSPNIQRVGGDLGLGNNSLIKQVADDIDDVTAVAGIIDDVTSVSDLGNELDTIVNKYDGTTNASGNNKNIKQIDTVADNIGDVNTVAADTSKIDTIATDLGNGASSFIKKVSDGMASVTTVAGYVGTALANGITWLSSTTNQNTLGAVEGKIAEIDAVEAKLPQIDAVAGVADEVAVVGESGYKDNVQTVANTDYKAKVTTVASMQDDVNTVASASSDIDTITTGANLSNIGTVVSNISAVQGASANAATASTGASTATTKANEASVSEANAETYMNTASGHATTAGTHKTAAQSAQAAAEAAQSVAEGASTSASNSKTQAAASENNAAASAASAQNSASSATASENQAEVYMNASNDWGSFYQKRYLGDASSNPSVDTAGNALENGALYFNTSDNTMYVYNGSTWVAAERTINNVNYGANLAANLNTNNHDISFGTNDKAKFGAGNDLQIFHNGNNSFITDTGAGSLYVRASDAVWIQSADNESMAKFNANNSVDLYYNNAKKLATTSTGIDVTGNKLDVAGDNGTSVRISLPQGNTTVGQRLSSFETYSNDTSGGISPSVRAAMDVVAEDTYGHKVGLAFSTTTTNNETDVERLRIDSSGKVGIGKTPQYLLDVNGIANVQGDVAPTGNGIGIGDYGTTGGYKWIQTFSNQPLCINPLGNNVGIGTSSPIYDFQIGSYGTDSDSTLALASTNSGTGSIRFGDGTSGFRANAGKIVYDHSNNSMQFATNGGEERLRIDSSGRVGIGTTSPKQQLHISGGNQDGAVTKVAIGATGANAETHLQLAERFTGNDMNYGFSFVADGNDTNNLLIKNHNASTAGAVALSVARTTGNVGIGTSSPATKLHVEGNILCDAYNNGGAGNGIFFRDGFLNTAQPSITLADHNGASPDGLSINAYDGISFRTANTERMRIDSSGNLLIGKTSTPLGLAGVVAYGGTGAGVIALTNASRPLYINKLTSDGNVIEIAKDGSTVGSIGTASGTLVIGSTSGADSYIRFGSNAIVPSDVNGTVRDNAIDLGQSNSRFKDLHLSGTVHTGLNIHLQDSGTTRGKIELNSSDKDDLDIKAVSLSSKMKFFTENTERMRIDSSGNLLVGTTSQFTGGSNASTTVTVDGSVGRKGNIFSDFDGVWSSEHAVIIEGVSSFNPSNSPNGESWYFVKAVSIDTGSSIVYCTQTATTLTGKIFTRYNNNVTGSGTWTSWVEK